MTYYGLETFSNYAVAFNKVEIEIAQYSYVEKNISCLDPKLLSKYLNLPVEVIEILQEEVEFNKIQLFFIDLITKSNYKKLTFELFNNSNGYDLLSPFGLIKITLNELEIKNKKLFTEILNCYPDFNLNSTISLLRLK